MKKIQIFIAILAAASLLLCSCMEYAFTTSSYKEFTSFAKRHKGGMEKQEVFERFGYPDAFYKADGEYQGLDYRNREKFKDEILGEYETTWIYSFMKYRDPAGPHRIHIVFDSEGKTVSAEITEVGGG